MNITCLPLTCVLLEELFVPEIAVEELCIFLSDACELKPVSVGERCVAFEELLVDIIYLDAAENLLVNLFLPSIPKVVHALELQR